MPGMTDFPKGIKTIWPGLSFSGKEYVNKILAKNARGIILLYILIFLS